MSANWMKLLKENKDLKDERKRAKKRKQIKNAQVESTKKKAKLNEKPNIWFDVKDEFLIPELNKKDTLTVEPSALARGSTEDHNNPLVKSKSFTGLTKALAIDCEMVGVGHEGKDSILARVSIVNQFGQCIYDKYVKPTDTVTDYRTHVSGIRPKDIANGEEFSVVQKQVHNMFEGRLLVGHAIQNDLKVLFLTHPRKMLRDTQRFPPFKLAMGVGKPALRKLSEKFLNVPIQKGEHNSVQDAQATMRLYTMFRKEWEKDLKERRPKKSGHRVHKKKKTTTTA